MLLNLEARERMTLLSLLPFGEPRCLDSDTAHFVRVFNSINDMLSDGYWRVVFEIKEIIYRELTLEFLASFTPTKAALKNFYLPNGLLFTLVFSSTLCLLPSSASLWYCTPRTLFTPSSTVSLGLRRNSRH
ncbi:unnamed protein product [Linum trigynum]|uniref:Uncharacterized protein n=1 Tax=Linum trigynum TaxID=586398 RepID=A0AAV2D073_9ROSI